MAHGAHGAAATEPACRSEPGRRTRSVAALPSLVRGGRLRLPCPSEDKGDAPHLQPSPSGPGPGRGWRVLSAGPPSRAHGARPGRVGEDGRNQGPSSLRARGRVSPPPAHPVGSQGWVRLVAARELWVAWPAGGRGGRGLGTPREARMTFPRQTCSPRRRPGDGAVSDGTGLP